MNHDTMRMSPSMLWTPGRQMDRFGGHVARVSGAQFLAATAFPSRRSSCLQSKTVERYVQGAPFEGHTWCQARRCWQSGHMHAGTRGVGTTRTTSLDISHCVHTARWDQDQTGPPADPAEHARRPRLEGAVGGCTAPDSTLWCGRCNRTPTPSHY